MTGRAPLVLLAAAAFAAPLAAQPIAPSVGTRSVTVSPFTPLGFPAIGVERITGPQRSQVTMLFGSAWRSVGHTPLQFGLLTHEWRRHRRAPGDGPYFGVHLGLHAFRVRKWDHAGTYRFQEGFGAHGGVSVGVQRALSDHLVLDAYVGGGTMQSLYKGYDQRTGDRYDGAKGWNKSGELAPYQTGVMLTYRLR